MLCDCAQARPVYSRLSPAIKKETDTHPSRSSGEGLATMAGQWKISSRTSNHDWEDQAQKDTMGRLPLFVFPAVTTVRKTIIWILYVQLVGPDLPKGDGTASFWSRLSVWRRDICYLKSRFTAITIKCNAAVLVYHPDTPGLRGHGIACILSKSWCVTNDSRSEYRCVWRFRFMFRSSRMVSVNYTQ